jgi:hypothetical protein
MKQETIPQTQRLSSLVQHNCHISDARHGRDYSMCIYLLKMREYYRWEMGYGYAEPLPKDELGEWLTSREQLWESLEDKSYTTITINGDNYEPFDNHLINERLLGMGLVYSGGIGTFAKPSFFLGKLTRSESSHGCQILVSGEEFARDLNAAPAMSLDRTIFVRSESLRRLIWEKIEEWQWNRGEQAMARALACYNFEHHLESSLNSMTANETEAVILHELGEVAAGDELGAGWKEMLSQVTRSRRELIARAIRDHIADCLVTLPTLLEQKVEPSIHFYFANLSGVRRAIFPQLILAYEKWQESGSLSSLKETVSKGADYWLESGKTLLTSVEQGKESIWLKLETELHGEEMKRASAG